MGHDIVVSLNSDSRSPWKRFWAQLQGYKAKGLHSTWPWVLAFESEIRKAKRDTHMSQSWIWVRGNGERIKWFGFSRLERSSIGCTEQKALCIQTNINTHNHTPRLFPQSGMPFSGYVLVTLSATFSSKLPWINTVINNPKMPQQLLSTLLQFG